MSKSVQYLLRNLAPFASAAALSLVGSSAVAAAAELQNDTGMSGLHQLKTGDQKVLENLSGSYSFAGQSIEFDNFDGVASYSTDVAYIVVVSGKVHLDDLTADKGQMLLIQPYGEEPVVERFDAERLRSSWQKNGKVISTEIANKLDALVRGQKRGIFLGQLGRTNFNVATLGSAKMEANRRETLGGETVRQFRFSGDGTQGDIEENIVSKFLAALIQGDEATVAELLDPQPYGYDNLGKEGGAARQLMAQRFIKSRDWQSFQDSKPRRLAGTRWLAQGRGSTATIDIRRTTDFAFVQSITVGE